MILYARCCDMMEEGNFVCCEEGTAAVAYCCCRGAAKCWCGYETPMKKIFCIDQAFCCDQRCQLPPGDIVPYGCAICGVKLAGNPGGSCKAAGGGDASAPSPEKQ